MAEGWLRHLKGDIYEVSSAGIEAHGLNPNAVAVMAEAGVDISRHRSSLLSEFDLDDIDCIVTVCGHADESCPVLPARVRKTHVGFDDPPKLAKAASTEDEALGHYRRVRDEIKEFIIQIEQSIKL